MRGAHPTNTTLIAPYRAFLQSHDGPAVKFAGGGKVEPLTRGGRDAGAAGALDGVRGVVMIGGGELSELRPEFGGQVPAR